MKILIIGGNGIIGRTVVERLRNRGDKVQTAGRKSGDLQVDIADANSIEAMFKEVGDIDAIVSVAGEA